MAFRTSREHFEELVEKAMDSLPEEFMRYFTNVTVIVDDYPDHVQAEKVHVRKEDLLGLFSGVPYPHKGGFFEIPYPLPDAILLFQRNIERISFSEQDLMDQIRKTLIHEVGHYFGLSEKELRKFGVG